MSAITNCTYSKIIYHNIKILYKKIIINLRNKSLTKKITSKYIKHLLLNILQTYIYIFLFFLYYITKRH